MPLTVTVSPRVCPEAVVPLAPLVMVPAMVLPINDVYLMSSDPMVMVPEEASLEVSDRVMRSVAELSRDWFNVATL